MTRGSESLLRPRSVAVIGASEDPRTFSGAPVFNLQRHGFTGAIYPVNPRRTELRGLRCFASILDIPAAVDTAVIAVPSGAVLPVLGECVRKGVGSATIVASGFEEGAGPAGRERAERLAALIRESGIRVLGPNTTGLVNLLDGYVPRAAHNQLDPGDVKAGNVALISQSGACSNIVFNQAQSNGVGVGLSVATGDQIDLDLWDLCELALDDDRIRTLLVVAETFGNVSHFERTAALAARRDKPIVLLKLGRSEMGGRAVMTHSGSLAGNAAVQSAAMRQLGVVEVDELDDLWRVALLLQHWDPAGAGPGGLGVVSYSGGEGALIADVCSSLGIDLRAPTPAYQGFIRANFEYATAGNPFDPSGEIVGRPEKVELALRGFFEQNDYSEVLIASPVLRPEQAERQLGDLVRVMEGPHPNVCFSYRAAGDLTGVQEAILKRTGGPVFRSSSEAVRAIALYRRTVARRRDAELRDVRPASGALAPDARYFDVRTELSRVGAPFAPAALVTTPEQASARAADLGFPVVMKVNVRSSTHKFANGLLVLDVRSADAVGRRYGSLEEAGRRFDARGIVVEATATGQVEVLIGADRDASFGATVLFGSGGMAVEYAHDTALALARYLTPADAASLVTSTRVGAFLRDRRPEIVAELATLLVQVATWFSSNVQIASLDLNPLVIDLTTGGSTCVDARVT